MDVRQQAIHATQLLKNGVNRMLDNARLQELKRNVFYKYFACHGEDQEQVFADRNDLIALIDSAMNIQDIKDAHYLAERGEYHVWEEPDQANHIESMVDRSYVMIKAGQLRPMYQAYSAMTPTSDEVQRAIETLELLDIEALKWATTFRASPFEQDSADLMKRRSDDITLAIQALKQYQMPTSDEILWQEIFSLREKLKIAVEAIKSYDPEFDDRLFLHQLNSADYDQLMEELSGDSQMQEPKPCDLCQPDVMDGNPIISRHSDNYVGNGKFSIAGLIAKYCPNCGRRLESE